MEIKMRVNFQNMTYEVAFSTKIKVSGYQIMLILKRIKRNFKEYLGVLKGNVLSIVMLITYILYLIGAFCYNYYRADVEKLSIIAIGIESLQQSMITLLFTVIVPIVANLLIFYNNKRKNLRERYGVAIHVKSVIEDCLGNMYPCIKAGMPDNQSLFRKLYEYRNKGWETENEYILNKSSKVYIAELLSCFNQMKKVLENEYVELLKRISREDIIKAEGLLHYVFYSENEMEYSRYMLEYRGEYGVVNYLYEMLEVVKKPWNCDKRIEMAINNLIRNDKINQANQMEVV